MKLTDTIISNKSRVFISNQVLGEFINVLIKKYKFTEAIITDHVLNIINTFEIRILETMDYETAIKLSYKYQISFYDALILAKALNSDCNILYSEDLSHNQIFENKLKVINPFL